MTGICTKFSLAAIWGILLAGAAAAAESQTLTVRDLIANSRQYDGTVVEVRGQLDNCIGLCAFCPEDLTREEFLASAADDEAYEPRRCLQLAFGRYGTRDWNLAADQIQSELYKSSVVTVTGLFRRGACWDLMFEPLPTQENDSGAISTCIGDPAHISSIQSVEVHEPRPVFGGLVLAQLDEPLVRADHEEREALMEAFANACGSFCLGEREVFLVQLNELSLDNRASGDPSILDAIGCVCRQASCEDSWPPYYVPEMNSADNPFYCWGMQNRDGRWHVLLNAL